MRLVIANGKKSIKISRSEWEKIGKTTGWVRQSQNMREFYHGTTSGVNNENITSFKKGINTSIAKGYGQGEGFYAWVNKNSAINHVHKFCDSSDGYLMIVTFQAELSPQNFNLDHEAMSSLTGQFIFDTWDVLFKKLPEGSIPTERGFVNILHSEKTGMEDGMTFIYGPNKNGRRRTFKASTEGDKGAGEMFGTVFNAIQKYFPQQTSDFQSKAFIRMVNSGKGAVKYIGQQKLFPSKIECFINNQWVDVTNQNPPAQPPAQPNAQDN